MFQAVDVGWVKYSVIMAYVSHGHHIWLLKPLMIIFLLFNFFNWKTTGYPLSSTVFSFSVEVSNTYFVSASKLYKTKQRHAYLSLGSVSCVSSFSQLCVSLEQDAWDTRDQICSLGFVLSLLSFLFSFLLIFLFCLSVFLFLCTSVFLLSSPPLSPVSL